jgi:hypothetical protein
MANNTYNVIDMMTRDAIRIAHEKTQFIGTVDRQYDKSFGVEGAKIGDTLRIQLPNQFSIRTGNSMEVQQIVERTAPATLATLKGVDIDFNCVDLKLKIGDLSKKYIQPAMSGLISTIEAEMIAYATKATYNSVGTAGTPPTSLAAWNLARAKLNQNLAPKDMQRAIQCDSVTMAGMVDGLKSLFQDQTQLKEQYREGLISRTSMADWYENDRMYAHTNGADVTGTTDAAALVSNGSGNLGIVATVAAADQVVGSVFTIAGVYACHPETKAAFPHLQQFVIQTAGTVTVVSPKIYVTGPYRNVGSATGAELAVTDFNSKTLTFVGAASTSYLQNLMYHKEAFQFITAPLPIMSDAETCAVRESEGLSMRLWQASDIVNNRMLLRLDILYGFAAIRPEWACRVTN